MDQRLATRLSKFLSLVLRHRPDDFGLSLDEQGFVDLEDLVDVIVAEDILAEGVTGAILELIDEADRQRFEVRDGRVRALYGHSARIRLDYPEDEPPAWLFHGSSPGAARRIRSEGIEPAGRAYVHLSATEEEALAVGGRHADQPVLIRVDTRAAREAGVSFHQATAMIWLCGSVPAAACEVPDVGEEPARPESAPRPPQPPPAPQAPSAPQTPSGGVEILGPAPEEGFRRRTRKKGTRR